MSVIAGGSLLLILVTCCTDLRTKKMGYYWTKLEVYNYDEFLGSFYTNSEKKSDIKKDIDEKYGIGNWTKYNIGN